MRTLKFEKVKRNADFPDGYNQEMFLMAFAESYLPLTEEQWRERGQLLAEMPPEEREDIMEFITSAELLGKEKLLSFQIKKRFGTVSPEGAKRLNRLTGELMDELGVALLDFSDRDELENWLKKKAPRPRKLKTRPMTSFFQDAANEA